MAQHKVSANPAHGHYEAYATAQFLPGCKSCGEKHPLAFKPIPQDTSRCPKCKKFVVAPGNKIDVPAKATGIFFANLLMRIGAWLNRMSERH